MAHHDHCGGNETGVDPSTPTNGNRNGDRRLLEMHVNGSVLRTSLRSRSPGHERIVRRLPTARLREICRAEGLPEAVFYELLGRRGAVCHPATAEVVTQVDPSKFLLLHEIAHLRYPSHGREHSDLWLRLLETYMPDRWREEE